MENLIHGHPPGVSVSKNALRGPVRLSAVGLIGLLLACSDLLDAVNPDVVQPDDLPGARGADLFYGGAVYDFAAAFSAEESGIVPYVGLFTDEFYLTGVSPYRREVDQRSMNKRNDPMGNLFASLHRARQSTTTAASKLAEIDETDDRIAEMKNLHAYVHLFFAEDYCSGVPLSPMGADGEPEPGAPRTTVEWLNAAVARFDSALAWAQDDQQKNLASVGKARALMSLNDYAAAADAVAEVPTSWLYQVRMSDNTWGQVNAVWVMTLAGAGRWSLSQNEGETGLDFRTPDPRVPWEETGTAFDGSASHYAQLKYPSPSSSITLASGIEARLIEAEAALAGGDVGTWLAKHDEIRALEGLDEMTDTGSEEARVDLHFAERARWLFAEGHRLADLRRLVRQYGRDPESVFPTGDYRTGGTYGTDVNWIIPQEEENNPLFTGCLDRGA